MKSCVILSSYNGEKTILSQLKSIEFQTRLPDKVIICDDFSTDKTLDIVQKFSKSTSLLDIYIIENSKNIGWKENFKNLINVVPNEYDVVFLCDQDDYWESNKIKNVMNVFENDESINLVVSDVLIWYESNKLPTLKYYKIKNKNGKVLSIANNCNFKRPGCSMAIKNDFAKNCYKYVNDISIPHDVYLWVCSYLTSSIYYSNKKLMVYKRYENSATSMMNETNNFFIKKNINNELIKCLELSLKIDNKNEKTLKHIKNKLKLEKIRCKIFAERSIINWIKCAKYIMYYPRFLSWAGDFKDTILKRYDNEND